MFSPDGFVSLYEVAENYRMAGVGIEKFIAQCSQVQAVAVCTPSAQPVNISTDLLHSVSWGGSDVFAFIDSSSWTVSLHLIREAAAGMTPELYVGSRLLLNTALDGSFAYRFPPAFVEGLEQFEGQQVVVRKSEADKLRAAIPNLVRKPIKKFATIAERDNAYTEFLNTFPGRKPTVAQREEWRKAYGISRDRERYELWDVYKPDDGSKPGVKPKTG